MRQIIMNAILVIESNKNSKKNKFKDIAIFKEDLELYDKTIYEYEEVETRSAKEERAELLNKFR